MNRTPHDPSCRALIIGGGIIGLAAAWYLARRGVTGVQVMERLFLAQGATPRAAALLSRARRDDATAAMVRETLNAIPTLEAELGHGLDMAVDGAVHVTATPASSAALEALMATVTARGDRVEWLTPAEARGRVPWLDPDLVDRAALCPDDGHIDPHRLAMGYAHAARRRGVVIRTGVGIGGLLVEGGRVTGVVHRDGAVTRAETVVLAAGAWSVALAADAGVGLGMSPIRSQYWITAPDPRFPRHHPATVLPDAAAYTRSEMGALLFGMRGGCPHAADPARLPDDVEGMPLDDADRGAATLEAGWEALARHCPPLEEVGIARYVSGLSCYTLDGAFLLGCFRHRPGLIVATGCCGAGIAASGGFGSGVAALVTGEPPPFDPSPLAPDRFGIIDPFDPSVATRCAAIRSHKRVG